jgi:hypothetical protein
MAEIARDGGGDVDKAAAADPRVASRSRRRR